MPRPGRLALVLLPVLIGLLGQVLPTRAQQSLGSRYAFADTTLLRDTLDLHFGGLFPTADSLQMTPDTLRALMIRYRMTMPRIVHLSDSLHVPVDSVGTVLERERFNPLAAAARGARSDFRYSSGYTVNRTSSTWTNSGDFNFTQGARFLHSVTNIQMDRYTAAGRTSLRQVRTNTAEAGWRLTPSLSLGGRANLERYDSKDPGSISNEGETTNEFQLSSRMRHSFTRNLQSDLNVFSGLLDQKNYSQIKKGVSGEANGHVRWSSSQWFSQDINGQVTGNVARTRKPSAVSEFNTHDLSTNLRGTVSLFSASRVGFNGNWGLRRSRIESPLDTTRIQRILTVNNSVDGTLRMRVDNDRYLNVSGSLGHSVVTTGSRDDKGGRAQMRWALAGFSLDANYGDARSTSNFPRRLRAYGYIENATNRSADATLTRNFSERLTSKLNGQVSLTRSRYIATADSATTPVPRDNYRQSYRADLLFNQSERISTGVALEVSLLRGINVAPKSIASNTDTRSYRAEWRWSVRVFKGLTVSQLDQIQADYNFYPYAAPRNNLNLNYNTITTLTAVVSQHFNMDLQHVANEQPRGNYTRIDAGPEALQLSDDALNYTLRANMTYTPSPEFSISLRPEYTATDRSGTNSSTGAAVKQRQDRRLSFSGGLNINKTIARGATLQGNIARTFDDQRTQTFNNGLGSLSPRALNDYWNGSLTLTWQL